MNRRKFIRNTGLLAASVPLLNSNVVAQDKSIISNSPSLIKPKALQKGDLIGLIAPGGAVFDHDSINQTKSKLSKFGFSILEGETLRTQHGYLSATDAKRAKDIKDMFLNPDVKAIVAIRGGSGCARLLPHLDYNLIRQNAKPFIGMSDITVLLNAFYSQAGLITYHGPVGYSTWEGFTWNFFKSTLMDKKKTVMLNPSGNKLFYTIRSGKAEGELIGGNLTVFCQLLGSDYLPNMENKILFLEDVKEEPYRIDRLLTQLKLSGIFEKINGIILGEFKNCVPEEPEKSFTLKEMFLEHFKDSKIPVFYGAKFGHVKEKWTFPIGIKAKMDADKGSVFLLEEAVS